MDLEAFRWLLGPAGQELLRTAEEVTDAEPDPVRAAARLRARAEPAYVAAALTQADLRRRARAKFGDRASRMYFTPDGLEQATRREVARHRAQRASFTGARTVIDLGCGIGGDLLALSEAGLTTAGVDLDPVRVAVAEANLGALDLGGAVRVADAETLDLSPFDLVVADPARRSARGRVFDPDSYQPPWSFVERLLTRPSVVKVAPGLPHERVPGGAELELVSYRGEVKEAAVWSPHLATTSRRATLIAEHGLATVTAENCPATVDTGPVARFLVEPDGAVIRAGLVGAVATAVGGHLLDEHIAYVATDTPPATPLGRGYRVTDVLPYGEKQLRAALRARDVGRLTIKKRGVDVVPEQLRRRLALRGTGEATLVLTRVAGKGTALLCEPC